MAGSIAMAAAAPHDRPVYALKAGLVAIAIWLFRQRLGSWRLAMPMTSIAGGALIGIAWIATAPSTSDRSELGQWLSEIGPTLAILWLVVRGLGTIVLVPIAEELAFRGYLYRRLIRRDFHHVGWTAFSWTALAVSSVAFGLLHERWLAGTLAGAIFALLMLRGGRLGDAIAAHATANALIFAWALAFRQWSLL
jgi:exosortase E/protease (VPEID-CTERM system)